MFSVEEIICIKLHSKYEYSHGKKEINKNRAKACLLGSRNHWRNHGGGGGKWAGGGGGIGVGGGGTHTSRLLAQFSLFSCSVLKIGWTRMHSSRMRTARSMTGFPGSLPSLGGCGDLGGGGGWLRWGWPRWGGISYIRHWITRHSTPTELKSN